MNENTPKKSNGLLVGVGAVVVVAIVVALAVMFGGSKQAVAPATTDTTTTTTSSGGTSTTTSGTGTASAYKDGTYSAVGHYTSPGGYQSLNVTLTLKDGVVTDATVTSGAGDPESNRYQSIFISGFKSQVVGKSIASLNLTKVAGSSLTPAGFDDALSSIKTQAKA